MHDRPNRASSQTPQQYALRVFSTIDGAAPKPTHQAAGIGQLHQVILDEADNEELLSRLDQSAEAKAAALLTSEGALAALRYMRSLGREAAAEQ